MPSVKGSFIEPRHGGRLIAAEQEADVLRPIPVVRDRPLLAETASSSTCQEADTVRCGASAATAHMTLEFAYGSRPAVTEVTVTGGRART